MTIIRPLTSEQRARFLLETKLLVLMHRIGRQLLKSPEERTRSWTEANLRKVFPASCVDRMMVDVD